MATLLEWDGYVPPFERLRAEVLRARAFIDGDTPVVGPSPQPVDAAAWSRRPLDAVVHSWTTEVRSSWIDAGFFALRA